MCWFTQGQWGHPKLENWHNPYDTSLHTAFLLQVQKQQEDLAVILASNKQQHKEKHKKKKIWEKKQNKHAEEDKT